MADDFKADDDFNPDDAHFSDEELEAALAGFEKEVAEQDAKAAGGTDAAAGQGANPDAEAPADPAANFDDELEGLIGNKAKVAVIITRLASAELLAAFCQLSDISAECLASREGAVAVLDNLNGDGPEAAAKDLTTVVAGMGVVLAVNRADKLEAHLYVQGKPGEEFVPPVLFGSTAPFVEDLMLGIATLDGLKAQGVTAVPSGKYDRESALQVIAKHTRSGRA
ncbi:hypothetical protein [Bifidobacterium avesanii]|uniref:Uncharacterized protein n=1 Tax=Bifidobacterium avesanii TaxID=1798157 RepID=A0A7K3TH43_9BIFI|nr:hypothetical protein [Bifidobacterium avesanii]KAB8290636.1 hypothetical protein DSM100685_1429 [Bifidobacterium avesanii]NEG78004.1 hypothetical protein [Bifidobacterium avesanii]